VSNGRCVERIFLMKKNRMLGVLGCSIFLTLFGFIASPWAESVMTPQYPNPERFEEDILAFEAVDQATQPPQGAIVGFGSSSMRGWHGTIQEDLAPLTIIPRGFGGSTMYDALHYADRIVLPYRPRAILLYEGDNDMAVQIPLDVYLETFKAFVNKVHTTLPDTRIYVLAIKPSISRWAIWPQMKEANKLLAEACVEDDRLIYIDIAGPMLNEDNEPDPDLFLADNLHLNENGYKLWTEIVRPILLEGELEAEKEHITGDE